MIGAIIGDVVGSRFEFINNRTKDFPLFHRVSTYTDDSVCTIAVANALLNNYPFDLSKEGIEKLKEDVKDSLINFVYKYPDRGYGGNFYKWVFDDVRHKPYNSYGNGSAMRVSCVGWLANSEEEVKTLARITAEPTHNHIEGIKGAEAIAMCIYMARNKRSKQEIKEYISDNYYPEIAYMNYRDLVKYNKFDCTCQGSVPEAIYCFLISKGFEDTLRIAVSIGDDSDTIACMAGSIAEAYYKDKKNTSKIINEFYKRRFIPNEFIEIINKFNEKRSINENY